MGRIIGVDLGTTLSAVAAIEDRQPKILPNAEGELLTPSIVAIDKKGEKLVGTRALRQAVTNPENTIFSIKRLLGRKFIDTEVQSDMKYWQHKIIKGPNGDALVVIRNRRYSPIEISAMILQKLKADAEAYLGDKVTGAVITVPSYFNDSQRQATKDAGTIAGLNVLRIINEPTAAALAYGLHKKDELTAVVIHFGGGTFDVSVLEIGEQAFQVKSTNGDTHLGGDDVDNRIIDWLSNEFKKEKGIDLRQDRIALQRLKCAAERAKKDLSIVPQTEINLPFITMSASGSQNMNINLTRAKLEQLCEDLLKRCLEPCKKVLADACLTPIEITDVVLVGGQTRMPKMREVVQKFFGKEPVGGVNTDEAVALGAAIQAGVLGGEIRDVLLLDVAPLSLSIETAGGVASRLIARNTAIPTLQSRIFYTTKDNQTNVEIHVVQGEESIADDNKTLGRFILNGILPAPRGVTQIEVTFNIDANGILQVSAKDKNTGKEERIVITAASGLSRDEVERITMSYGNMKQKRLGK